jgi:hypothetical protein
MADSKVERPSADFDKVSICDELTQAKVVLRKSYLFVKGVRHGIEYEDSAFFRPSPEA